MPKIPLFVIDWIMYWDDGGAGFLAIRFNFHLEFSLVGSDFKSEM